MALIPALTSAHFHPLVDVRTRQRFVTVKSMPLCTLLRNTEVLLTYLAERPYPGPGNTDHLLDCLNFWGGEIERQRSLRVRASLTPEP